MNQKGLAALPIILIVLGAFLMMGIMQNHKENSFPGGDYAELPCDEDNCGKVP